MILVFVEHSLGIPEDPSLEATTVARRLAEDIGEASLCAVSIGPHGSDVAEHLGQHGVDEVIHIDHDRFDTYAPEAWAESLSQVIAQHDPDAVVAPGTDRGHEVLAHVGAKLDLPMAANCMNVEATDNGYQLERQRWGGSLIEYAQLESDTKLLTAAPHEVGIEMAETETTPGVEPFAPSLKQSDFRVQVDRVEEHDDAGVSLGEARVVVGGGRGVGGPEGYEKLEELAAKLDGTVGASRAAVNEGWRPHDDQIGQTGTKINPKLYIACGISGAVQHWVGCKGSDNVLAINTDPEAAIMQKADYAVVGDLHEVVPELNDML